MPTAVPGGEEGGTDGGTVAVPRGATRETDGGTDGGTEGGAKGGDEGGTDGGTEGGAKGGNGGGLGHAFSQMTPTARGKTLHLLGSVCPSHHLHSLVAETVVKRGSVGWLWMGWRQRRRGRGDGGAGAGLKTPWLLSTPTVVPVTASRPPTAMPTEVRLLEGRDRPRLWAAAAWAVPGDKRSALRVAQCLKVHSVMKALCYWYKFEYFIQVINMVYAVRCRIGGAAWTTSRSSAFEWNRQPPDRRCLGARDRCAPNTSNYGAVSLSHAPQVAWLSRRATRPHKPRASGVLVVSTMMAIKACCMQPQMETIGFGTWAPAAAGRVCALHCGGCLRPRGA